MRHLVGVGLWLAADHPRRPLAEVLLVCGGVMAGTFAVTRLRGTALDDAVHLAVGLLFLGTALRMAQSLGGLERFGISLGGVLDREEPLLQALRRATPAGLREAGVALLVAAAIFPPFALGFGAWHGPSQAFRFALPDDALSFWLGHLVVVGLPEEAFFRGYVQTRLEQAFPARRRVLLADVSLRALVLQALLFGLVHALVDLNPARMVVFFPGLVFGWLRAWRGGIAASIVFHAGCNFFQAVLVESWLR